MAVVATHFALALVLLMTSFSLIDTSTAATHITKKLPRPLAMELEPLSPAGYRRYIVFLRFHPDLSGMDDAVQRGWHHSFLPSNMTSEGKQWLQHSYTVFNGFSALLTEEEAKVLAAKPYVSVVIPGGYRYKQTTRRTYGRHRRIRSECASYAQ